MQQYSKHSWMYLLRKPWFTITIIFVGLVLCGFGLLLLAGYFSSIALASLQQSNFFAAENYSKKSLPIVRSFNFLTLGLIPDLVVWNEALKLPVQAHILTTDTQSIAEHALLSETTISIEQLLPTIEQISTSVSKINSMLPTTFLLKSKISLDHQQMLTTIDKSLLDLHIFIEAVSQGKQTWVVVLQNNDEVRATGGFPGSYVLLNFDTGILKEIVVEDIYDADGQFSGYIDAPSGIREYTSGDKGLRLPDANWWPDFPTSAQTMLQFFALGDKRNIAGVVALNLSTAKTILHLTGPLLLPDYQIEVTEENVGEVLRAERSEFFPGSTQKKHILQLTLTQLKQRLIELSPEKQLQLLTLLQSQVKEKEVQIYSTNPETQSLLSKYFLTGELNQKSIKNSEVLQVCNCIPISLALVESNVGINKVNKYVTRENSVIVSDKTLRVTTTFTNNAAPLSTTELSNFIGQPAETTPRNGNGYLNYYRVLISPEYTVKSITIGNNPVTTWDEELITTSSGDELKQVGVLIGIPEKNLTSVTFEFNSASAVIPSALAVFKQSGIPPSTYKINSPSTYQELNLIEDSFIKL